MDQQVITFLRRFISNQLENEEWFKNTKLEVKAIIFYGSRAKETNRNDSDYDILVILPLEVERKFTKGEYFYQFEGREINIVIRSIERLRQIAAKKEDRFQKEVFRKSVIIYEKDTEVKELLNEISMIK